MTVLLILLVVVGLAVSWWWWVTGLPTDDQRALHKLGVISPTWREEHGRDQGKSGGSR